MDESLVPAGDDLARDDTADALRLLTCGLVGGDVSVSGIARFGGVSERVAHRVLDVAGTLGIIGPDGEIDLRQRRTLVADLPVELVAEIHAAASRHWMAAGPAHLVDAVRHARAAGELVAQEELVEMAERSGRLCLSLGEYESAVQLLRTAIELDGGAEPTWTGNCLCDLAAALDGCGRVTEAREQLARAATLGELVGDNALVARAAVAYALPADWYAGDQRAVGLLFRAEQLDLDPSDAAMVCAARALVEIRVPLTLDSHQQLAWVTRADVAHALADEAVERASSLGVAEQGFAALAWRATHRSPALLDSRRRMSTTACDIAQRLRQPRYQVEANIWLAVDALESVDRPLFDEALSVVRWVAESDGNPRLVWRADTISAGAAHLDGDLDEARRWRLAAREVGSRIDAPGWLGADLLLLGEEVLQADDPALWRANMLDEDSPALINPLGRATAAFLHLSLGEPDAARRMVERSLRQLDLESSYLLVLSRCSAVAHRLGDAALATTLADLLEPYRGHVIVDSNGWWCDGPVDLWLAALLATAGDTHDAARALVTGEEMARRIGDARGLRLAADLRALPSMTTAVNDVRARSMVHRPTVDDPSGSALRLSPRQVAVLQGLARGLSNKAIGQELAFSTGTVSAECQVIYRTLGVNGRTEAVMAALAQGLLD